MVDGPRWWSSSTSPRGSSDWRGVPQRAPVRPTSRLRSRPKTETPTSSDLVAGLIGGEVDTSVTPNAPHRSSWHTSLLPHPLSFPLRPRIRILQSSHAREDPSLCRCPPLSLSSKIFLTQDSFVLRNFELFFSPATPPFSLAPLPPRGSGGFFSSERMR